MNRANEIISIVEKRRSVPSYYKKYEEDEKVVLVLNDVVKGGGNPEYVTSFKLPKTSRKKLPSALESNIDKAINKGTAIAIKLAAKGKGEWADDDADDIESDWFQAMSILYAGYTVTTAGELFQLLSFLGEI